MAPAPAWVSWSWRNIAITLIENLWTHPFAVFQRFAASRAGGDEFKAIQGRMNIKKLHFSQKTREMGHPSVAGSGIYFPRSGLEMWATRLSA
jgi:hypothetical protein